MVNGTGHSDEKTHIGDAERFRLPRRQRVSAPRLYMSNEPPLQRQLRIGGKKRLVQSTNIRHQIQCTQHQCRPQCTWFYGGSTCFYSLSRSLIVFFLACHEPQPYVAYWNEEEQCSGPDPEIGIEKLATYYHHWQTVMMPIHFQFLLHWTRPSRDHKAFWIMQSFVQIHPF